MQNAVPDGTKYEKVEQDASNPFDIYVLKTTNDPKHHRSRNQQVGPGVNRAVKSEGDFETLRTTNGTKTMNASIAHSSPHTTDRKGNREPQKVAGNVPAWDLMNKNDKSAPKQGELATHEYCHLIGDGDGGACESRNLVIGTNQVNTEQLAMEGTLRRYTEKFKSVGWQISLNVDAILSNGTSPRVPIEPTGKWATAQVAEWIRYEIKVTPRFNDAKFNNVDRLVHRQIMDGQRGLISMAEVAILEDKVAHKMEAKFSEVSNLNAPVPFLPGNVAKNDQYTGVQVS